MVEFVEESAKLFAVEASEIGGLFPNSTVLNGKLIFELSDQVKDGEIALVRYGINFKLLSISDGVKINNILGILRYFEVQHFISLR